MKCVHCNGEHPDGFKFCPVTGKEMVQSFKACTNPECVDFEKHILPFDALFCPRCGQKIGSFYEHKKNDETSPESKNTFTEMFFPMYGVTLGRTTIEDVDERNVDEDPEFEDLVKYEPYYSDTRFFILPGQDCFSAVIISEGADMPKKFSECRFEMNMKPKEIRKCLRKYDLIIQDSSDYEDVVDVADGEDVIAAKSQDGRLLMLFILDSYSELSAVVIELAINGSFQFVNKYIKSATDSESEEDEYDDDYDEEIECPECESTDIEDDGSGYMQYICNDCGHHWGHCDTAECPECYSNDIENDGTDNLQYKCNACGYRWGDDEYYDDNENEGEYDNDTDNAGNEMSEYLKAFGVVCGISSKYDVEQLGGKPYDSSKEQYRMPERFHVYFRNNSHVVTSIDFFDDNIPEFYRGLGVYWKMSLRDFKNVFQNLGFRVEEQLDQDIVFAYGYCKRYHLSVSVYMSKGILPGLTITC